MAKPARRRSRNHPHHRITDSLESGDRGRIFGRPLDMLLIYPQPYAVGMASLGFLFTYRRLRMYPELNVERAFLSRDGQLSCAVESGRAWRDFPLLAFSISYEPDLLRLRQWALDNGLPLASADRPAGPRLLFGGTGCRINPALLEGVADYWMPGRLEERRNEKRLRDWLGGLLGRAPHPESLAPVDAIYATLFSPEAAFGEALLIEVQRGCPFRCPFCWIAASERCRKPLPPGKLLELIDRYPGPARIGLISPCLTEYPGLPRLLRGLITRHRDIGFASLRLDRLDEELIELFLACGMKTLTGAPESGSRKWKRIIGKTLTTQQLAERLRFAVDCGLAKVKLYYLYGLPGETKVDLQATVQEVEHVRDALACHGRVALEVALNPFVPKPGTAWENEPIAPARELRASAALLRRAFGRSKLKCQWGSIREAQTQYRLSRYEGNLASWPGGLKRDVK